MLPVNAVGERLEGKPHEPFDGGAEETRWSRPVARLRSSLRFTSGSEVRAGETDRPKGRHRAPARPYPLAWLSCLRRLALRWDRGSERRFAFVLLACALVCVNRLGPAIRSETSRC